MSLSRFVTDRNNFFLLLLCELRKRTYQILCSLGLAVQFIPTVRMQPNCLPLEKLATFSCCEEIHMTDDRAVRCCVNYGCNGRNHLELLDME